MKRQLICINCPLGCSLEITKENGKYLVTGNSCPRGAEYAVAEMTAPKRIVTSSVFVSGGTRRLVSVKTKEGVPKDRIFDCMKELRRLTAQAPVRIGDVLLDDLAGTGVPVVATSRVDCRKRRNHESD